MPEWVAGRASAVRRSPILVIIATVLVVGGLVDRVGGSSSPPPAAVVEPVPVAAPADALSSSWFCAGATDGGAVDARGTLVIANAGSSAATGVVTVVTSSGTQARRQVSVASMSSVAVAETVKGGAPWVGAIVDMDAGAVAVDQVIDSPVGRSVSPCATSGSSHWYFANGETLVNAGVAISLLNPYPTDSIVDLSFTTDQGLEAPEDFQGLDVPGGGLLTVNLGSHLRRRQEIAVDVSVRTGSVVAWKTDWVDPPAPGSVLVGTPAAENPLADPAAPIPGVTVTLGSPSLGTSWTWPDGLAGNGTDEQYLIYNPGPTTADVRLSIGLDQGTSGPGETAEPFQLSVGPYQVVPVVSEQQARIPSGVAHSAVLQSTNGVGVVAERTVAAQVTGSSQTAETGLGELLGGRTSATQWLVPATGSDSRHSADLVVFDAGRNVAHVRVYQLAGGQQVPLPGVPEATVASGQRRQILLSGSAAVGGPLLVVSDEPIYVESDLYGGAGTGGVSLDFGVPLNP